MQEKLKESSIHDNTYATYVTTEDLNNESRIRANSDNLLLSNISSLWEDYGDYKSINNLIVNKKQEKTDDNLVTNDKTVSGAINEIFRMIQELHNRVVSNN